MRWMVTAGTLSLAPATTLDPTGLEDAALGVERELRELEASASANFQTGCIDIEINDVPLEAFARSLGTWQGGGA
jgi:hypothetical protein